LHFVGGEGQEKFFGDGGIGIFASIFGQGTHLGVEGFELLGGEGGVIEFAEGEGGVLACVFEKKSTSSGVDLPVFAHIVNYIVDDNPAIIGLVVARNFFTGVGGYVAGGFVEFFTGVSHFFSYLVMW
jgi:hypothetical protein